MLKCPGKYYKYCRLVINFFVFISVGAMNGIMGPTMPDLSIRVSADYQEIGRTFGIKKAASIIPPFFAGMLYDRFPRSREFGIGVIAILGAAFEIGVPYCTGILSLSVLFALHGFCMGGMATAGQSIIIELFGARAMAALQFMHLGWGLGNFLSTFIVRPFLDPNLKLSKKQLNYPCLANTTSSSTNLSYGGNKTTLILSKSMSQIEYAYVIICSYAMFMGLIALLFSFIPKPKRSNDTDSNANSKKSIREMLGPATISDGKPLFGVFMLISIVLIYATATGTYVALSSYMVTIAMDPCKPFTMTQSSATLLQGAFYACFSGSRIVFGLLMVFLLSKKVEPGVVISIYSASMAVSLLCLATIGFQSETGFWILTCTYAFFIGPFYGGTTPWFNQYIRVTSSVVALAIIGADAGKLIEVWLGGYLLRVKNSLALLHGVLGFSVVTCATVISVFVVSRKVGKRISFETPSTTRRILEVSEAENLDDKVTLPLHEHVR